MTLPNVVIAGAPKSGTTSLFAWLNDHPQVCGASVKETHYLVDRGTPLFNPACNYADHGLAGYESFFAHCDPARAQVILEATPEYLYRRTALEVLSSLDPAPQVVFVLRKPSERTYSFYQYARNNMAIISPATTFRDFVSMLRTGAGSFQSVPGGVERVEREAWSEYGIQFSRYSDYLGDWLSRFPPQNLHLFLFEALQADQSAFMRSVAAALGIDQGYYADYHFPRKKQTYNVRLQMLQRTRLRMGRLLPRSSLKRALRKALTRPYTAMNVRRGQQARSDDDVRVLKELDAEFAPLNRRLAEQTGLDLSAWA
ncbi:MAG: sulfotransferase domain-containing protein [Candidatus Limnocylindria bacterium]